MFFKQSVVRDLSFEHSIRNAGTHNCICPPPPPTIPPHPLTQTRTQSLQKKAPTPRFVVS